MFVQRFKFVLAASTFLAPMPAFAQDGSGPSAPQAQVDEGSEIVVTARRREERLIDVPASVSVLGEAVIDDDHRRMIGLIALLEAAARGELDLDATGRVLVELTELCREHFIREEEVQARIGFPDLEDHKVAHAMLQQRLDSTLRHYRDGDDEVRAGIVRTLGDSLATWLLTHITGSDMEFLPYMGRK